MCTCIRDSLYCTAESNTTLEVYCTPIKIQWRESHLFKYSEQKGPWLNKLETLSKGQSQLPGFLPFLGPLTIILLLLFGLCIPNCLISFIWSLSGCENWNFSQMTNIFILATHCSILAWRIPWREEPGRLQSVGSRRVGYDWVTNSFTFTSWFCLSLRLKWRSYREK